MTQHMPDLICAVCLEDTIFTNGDTDCCAECGGHDYIELEHEMENTND
jgi:rRNA maturation endonuclease Nob1